MFSKSRLTRSLLVTFAGIVLAANIVLGYQAQSTKWLAGNQLAAQLQTHVSASWTNALLKESLHNFAIANRVCIVLDRRIDPDQPFEFEARDTTFENVLRGVAMKLKSGVSFYGPLVYLGPTDVAAKLKTLAALRTEEIRSLPNDAQKKWFSSRVLAWTKPTNPRELLTMILKNVNAPRLAGLALPSDLWAANSWPMMNSIEQLTLLLAQFDLAFQLSSDGQTITFIPIPEKVTIVKEYKSTNLIELNENLKSLNLKGSHQIQETKLVVDSTIEEQESIQHLILGKPSKKTEVTEGEKRYTLTIKLPLRELAKGLAPKLGVTFQFDESAINLANISLDRKIDLQVKDATLNQLLDALFKPAGLKHEKQEGNRYLIRPAK